MWILNNAYFQILAASVLAFAVYAVGLSGGFYFDDEWNILSNQALHLHSLEPGALWHAASSGTAGPLGRPFSMLTFALNHVFFGLDPFYFKLVNLFVHLLCGWAIYALALALCPYLTKISDNQRHIFAFLLMLLWLLHPLNLTTVLYPVQRMAGLSALFCLLGMFSYVKARQCSSSSMTRRVGYYLASFLVFWPLALASKENAALFPAYLFLLELAFLKFRRFDQESLSYPLVLSYITFFLVPVVFILLYFSFSPDWILASYGNRDFTFYERILTESRILVFYISQVFLPINSSLGLFHDDILISKSIFSPWTTIISLVLIALAIVWSFFRIRDFPVVAFSVLFYFAAHLIESSVYGLELVHEHRNYLASFSILFSIAYYLMVGCQKTLNVRALVAVFFVMFLSITTVNRAATWGEASIHVFTEVSNHPGSPRANYSMGKQYAVYANSLNDGATKKKALNSAAQYFEKSANLRESYTDGLFGLLMMEGIEGYKMKGYYYTALNDRLANPPFPNNNYNYINSLFDCLDAGECDIPQAKIIELISSASKNSRFSGRHKEFILSRYQDYLN